MRMQVDGAVVTLTAVAAELDSIRSELNGTVWSGPDADRFHDTWETEITAQLGVAQRLLRSVTTVLIDD